MQRPPEPAYTAFGKLIYSPARKIYKYWLNRYVPYAY
jgi:hypothetical protein